MPTAGTGATAGEHRDEGSRTGENLAEGDETRQDEPLRILTIAAEDGAVKTGQLQPRSLGPMRPCGTTPTAASVAGQVADEVAAQPAVHEDLDTSATAAEHPPLFDSVKHAELDLHGGRS